MMANNKNEKSKDTKFMINKGVIKSESSFKDLQNKIMTNKIINNDIEEMDKFYKKYPELKDADTCDLLVTQKYFNEIKKNNYNVLVKKNNEEYLHKFMSKNEYEANLDKIKSRSKISVLFLKRFLFDDVLFEKLENSIKENKETFTIRFFDEDTKISNSQIILKNIDIVRGLVTLSATKKDIKKSMREKIDSLASHFDYQEFEKKLVRDDYKINFDGKMYAIRKNDMIEYMKTKNSKLVEHYKNDFNTTICGVPKDFFIYEVRRFYENIDKKCILPDPIADNFDWIHSDLREIDFKNLSGNLKRNNEIDEFNLNYELEKEILRDMPKKYSKAEQVIYVYIKMCKLFSYDTEFYAVNEKGVNADKYRKIEYLNGIDLNHTNIRCHEFTLIYQKILDDLGIESKTERFSQNYVEGHTKVLVKVDKYFIEVDLTKDVLQCDLFFVKFGENLHGLICSNDNKESREAFNKIIDKVYAYINENDSPLYMNAELDKKLENELIKYHKYSESKIITPHISVAKKFKYFKQLVNESNFKEMDSISYMLLLKNAWFSDLEQKKYFNMLIMKNNIPKNKTLEAQPIAIIAFSPKGKFNSQKNFNINNKNALYYTFDLGNELTSITKEEIEEKILSGAITFEKKTHYIPGFMFQNDKKQDIKTKQKVKEITYDLSAQIKNDNSALCILTRKCARKIKKIKSQVMKKHQKNEREYEKYISIKNILEVENCFLKMDIATSYAILKDLRISKFKLNKVYAELISPKNVIINNVFKY